MREKSFLNENKQTMSLLHLINKKYEDLKLELQWLSYKDISEFITNDKKSTEFIRAILRDDGFSTPTKDSDLFVFSQARARHSAISFLIGLIFFEYEEFQSDISAILHMEESNEKLAAIKLWMITALYHDYGYFVKDITNGSVNFESKVKHYLFDASSKSNHLCALHEFDLYKEKVLAYTYSEIFAYDKYSRQWHEKRQDGERVDHGILGAVLTFDRLIRRMTESKKSEIKNEFFQIKAACLTIAQHNIYKSASLESDKEYGSLLEKLHSTSDFVINKDTPLLLLLSLVDTFECVKRMSKGENESEYLTSKTVLSNILISVSPDKIMIDSSKLKRYIDNTQNSQLKDKYEAWKNGILGLSKWTTFLTDKKGEIIRIKMRPKEHKKKHEDYDK